MGAFICRSVCLFTCVNNNSKSNKRTFMNKVTEFSERSGHFRCTKVPISIVFQCFYFVFNIIPLVSQLGSISQKDLAQTHHRLKFKTFVLK